MFHVKISNIFLLLMESVLKNVVRGSLFPISWNVKMATAIMVMDVTASVESRAVGVVMKIQLEEAHVRMSGHLLHGYRMITQYRIGMS